MRFVWDSRPDKELQEGLKLVCLDVIELNRAIFVANLGFTQSLNGRRDRVTVQECVVFLESFPRDAEEGVLYLYS